MTSARWIDALFLRGIRTARLTVGSTMLMGLSVATSGCASHGKHENGDDDIHPVAVEIDNNLTVPTDVMVYVDQGGPRIALGSVAGAQTKTFQFTPVSFSQPYRLIAFAQLKGALRSQDFTVGSAEMGTIEWNMQANILSFYDVLDATSPQASPTPASPPAPAPASPPAPTPPPSSPQR